MRVRTMVAVATCVAAGLAGTAVAAWPANAATTAPSDRALRIGRQTLPANDGWASAGTGTTGGAAAAAANISVVHNREELVAALGGNNATNRLNATPKIIFVDGVIDANVDTANNPLTCADYHAPGYSLEQYLATYDPAVWGTADPSGPLEEARVASARAQTARIRINIGSNTTIVGLNGSKITGAQLNLDRVSNVIIRNLTIADAHDCFPAWDPTDGDAGNWNALYDTVTLTGATNVWVDHNAFDDGDNNDADQPRYFGRPYQVHDGALDIIRASDLVTVSYNHFRDHDKTMLIGSSNNAPADAGKLRVTLHHNRFSNVVQRAPRVRYGQVDLYSNYFQFTDEDSFSYAWGVGVNSALYAENNFVLRSADIPLDAIVYNWGGLAMTEKGTMTRVGTGPVTSVSLVEAFNAAHDPDLGLDAGWTPTLRADPVTPTEAVPAVVTKAAGTGRLRT